jgi:hypothetical protein
MTTRDSWNVIEAGLASLGTYDADPARIERIRVRCMASLALGRRRREIVSTPPVSWRRWIEPALAFGLSAVYLFAAVSNSLALLH